ncbi:hypothetical protein ScPMuIL_005535 [Solemya velum]
MSTDGAKESTGGIAYEYILKPASDDGPRPPSPPKEKKITHEDIKQKLLKAEERRQSLEAQKLETIARDKAKIEVAASKVQEEVENFSRLTKDKLRRSLEVTKENREAQIKALQDRLRDHLGKVEEVCKSSDKMAKELEEKINQKFETYEENRNAQLQAMLVRLKDHAQHIDEVCKASEGANKSTEQKIIQKMENAIKNRQERLQQIQKRMQEHERKIEEVRKNKAENPPLGCGDGNSVESS